MVCATAHIIEPIGQARYSETPERNSAPGAVALAATCTGQRCLDSGDAVLSLSDVPPRARWSMVELGWQAIVCKRSSEVAPLTTGAFLPDQATLAMALDWAQLWVGPRRSRHGAPPRIVTLTVGRFRRHPSTRSNHAHIDTRIDRRARLEHTIHRPRGRLPRVEMGVRSIARIPRQTYLRPTTRMTKYPE